jgi:hypothetical protein
MRQHTLWSVLVDLPPNIKMNENEQAGSNSEDKAKTNLQNFKIRFDDNFSR